MKNYDKNIKLSYLMYLDANNPYGWGNVSKIACKWFLKSYLNLTKTSIKDYDENSNDISLK